ncbi:hypothetical protein A9404_00550 [Halothiobacillus diazotrophicus]|uniref:Uncharacterized protein n=1 Tax=Halothiobacillus diazotrophicus TaxID=1860122 RepID=A0A191ZDX8_9GAMM|nr:hypothetical protein A9404_00550 [Halothiobacillus diazotrophicus]
MSPLFLHSVQHFEMSPWNITKQLACPLDADSFRVIRIIGFRYKLHRIAFLQFGYIYFCVETIETIGVRVKLIINSSP